MIAYATSRLRHAETVSSSGVVSTAYAACSESAITASLDAASPVLR
jgi:hypothetical protein